jgi:hypothetical protein
MRVQWLAAGEPVAVGTIAGRGDHNSFGSALVLNCSPQVANVGGLNRPVIQLGLHNELAASDGMRVVGDAVDATVTTGPVKLGIEAHLGEQVLDEGLEFLGAELKQVGSFVNVGDNVDRIDDARVGHAVRHDRLDGDQLVWMRRNIGEEVLAHAFDWIELRLSQNQGRELLPGSAERDEMRLDLLPGERVDGMHASVEDDRTDDLAGRGIEDLAQSPEGDL